MPSNSSIIDVSPRLVEPRGIIAAPNEARHPGFPGGISYKSQFSGNQAGPNRLGHRLCPACGIQFAAGVFDMSFNGRVGDVQPF